MKRYGQADLALHLLQNKCMVEDGRRIIECPYGCSLFFPKKTSNNTAFPIECHRFKLTNTILFKPKSFYKAINSKFKIVERRNFYNSFRIILQFHIYHLFTFPHNSSSSFKDQPLYCRRKISEKNPNTLSSKPCTNQRYILTLSQTTDLRRQSL